MKFSLKTLSLAVALAASATGANAAIDNGGAGDGDLFLNLNSSASSYTRDLGYSLSTFQSAINAAGNLNLIFTADNLLTTWLGAEQLAKRSVEMNIFAVDASGARNFLSTFNGTLPSPLKKDDITRSAVSEVGSFLAFVNPSLTGSVNSATFAAGTNGYAGKTKPGFQSNFNDTVFNYLGFKSTKDMSGEIVAGQAHQTLTGNKLELVKITALASGASNSFYTPIKDGANKVEVYFDASNTLHIQAVPEPESYAMLLAGLGMLGFMARRRLNTRV